ncbi:MAG TPA: AsmA family protein [Anaerohalosphaeraceae bacterium]|nr:AsmA family protein [Anaerohalosphaeraceae bacterium]
MEEKKNQSETVTPKKRSLLKKIIWAVCILIAVLILLVALLPTLISTSLGKQIVVSQINNATNGDIQINDLSLGWFSGLKLSGVTFKDSTGDTSVSVNEVRLNPKLSSLLRGQINLIDGLIDKPQVDILVKELPQKTTPTEPEKPSGPSAPAQPVALPLEKLALQLREGTVAIRTDNPPQRLEFKNISSQVDINPLGQASKLSFAMAVGGMGQQGDVKAEGTVTPSKELTLKGTSGDVQVELVNLKLEDFKPLLALAGQKIDIAGLLNAKADVKLNDGQFEKIAADATIENFKQTLDGKTTTLDKPVKIKALAAMIDNKIRIDNVNVDSSFCTANCKGDLEQLTYQAKADLAGVQSFAAQFTDMAGYKLAGSLNAAGSVALKGDTIAAAGSADFQNLAVAKGTNKMPPSAVKINYDVVHDGAAKLLKANSVDATLDAGTVVVKSLSMPLDPEKMTQLSAQADVKLDLKKALDLAKVFAADSLPADLTLAGNLNSVIDVRPQGSDIVFRTDKTEIQKLSIGQGTEAPFTQDTLTLVANGTVNPATKAFATKFDLEGKKAQSLMIFKGTVSQKADQAKTALAGDIQADYDWKEVTAMAKPFLPEGLAMEGKRSDKITFASTYPSNDPNAMLANLNANAALGFQKADFKGLKFGATELKLNVKQGQAAIDLPDADVNGGKVRFAGDVNLAQKPMVLKLRQPAAVVENVKIDDVLSANLLQYLHPIFAKSSNVSGTANLSCTTLVIPLGGGTPKDINIEGTVGMTDVRLTSKVLAIIKEALRDDGLNLFSIPASPFTVKNGLVKYDDMPLMFGRTWGIHFGGTIDLMSKALSMNVKAPTSKAADAKMVVVPLAGTVENPQLDAGKFLMGNITEQIKEQIPVKDEKTKEAIEKGLDALDGLFNKGKK